MTFTIRALEPADRERWEPLWQGYLTFYKTKLADEVSDETFRRLTNREREPLGAVAVADDGAFLGIVHWLYHATTWAIAPTCYLQDLFTVPEARGKGVGRALIAHVYDDADARGAASVYWLTQEFNATARRLYDKVAQVTPFVRYRR